MVQVGHSNKILLAHMDIHVDSPYYPPPPPPRTIRPCARS